MTSDADSPQDKVLEYIERFALVLNTSGLPRMPARVFAFTLADDATEYTAAELAAGLRVSTAAISGAVRYLVDVGMLVKGRKPGSRADHYAISDQDLWSSIMFQQQHLLAAFRDVAEEGVDVLGVQSVGGRRLWETKEFFVFMEAEQHNLLQRWEAHLAEAKARWNSGEEDAAAHE
ncbi:MAG TPA: hypothetical protein H9881_14405 [Candidatus Stackebrandtia excrementipullorum]|nr:hypothetical protein [Candidatus Stackebrandtia excrementipullorum]